MKLLPWIKSRLIRQKSVEKPLNDLDELMNRVREKIADAAYPELISYANGLHYLFGKGIERSKQTKQEYINLIIMPLVGTNTIPTVLIGQSSEIIQQFQKIVRMRLQSIMDDHVPRLK